MELKGKIIKIYETMKVGEKGFKKRPFVISTFEEYPQEIILEVIGDKVAMLDRYKEGDKIEASINIRGREWINPQGEVKYFNTIQAWRIKILEGVNAGANNQEPQGFDDYVQDNDEEDLPF